MDGQSSVIIDASTLINFLAVNRLDLLVNNCRYRFVITEHVRGEVTDAYPHQLALLDEAIASGAIEESPVTDIQELALFATLEASGQLGLGECASIAAAHERALPLAIDDLVASKKARALNPGMVIFNTQQIMVQLIQDGVRDVASADAIKDEWERDHRFLLKIASFADLI